jgi:hypothetical protein
MVHTAAAAAAAHKHAAAGAVNVLKNTAVTSTHKLVCLLHVVSVTMVDNSAWHTLMVHNNVFNTVTARCASHVYLATWPPSLQVTDLPRMKAFCSGLPL